MHNSVSENVNKWRYHETSESAEMEIPVWSLGSRVITPPVLLIQSKNVAQVRFPYICIEQHCCILDN